MGISGLLPLLKEIQQPRNISDFKGKRWVAREGQTLGGVGWLGLGLVRVAYNVLTPDSLSTRMSGSTRARLGAPRSSSRAGRRPGLSNTQCIAFGCSSFMASPLLWCLTVGRCLPSAGQRIREQSECFRAADAAGD